MNHYPGSFRLVEVIDAQSEVSLRTRTETFVGREMKLLAGFASSSAERGGLSLERLFFRQAVAYSRGAPEV